MRDRCPNSNIYTAVPLRFILQQAQVGAAHLEVHPDDSSEQQRNAWKEKYNYVKKHFLSFCHLSTNEIIHKPNQANIQKPQTNS